MMENLENKITDALSRPVCTGWDRGFLESIYEQISKGRALSPAQTQTLGKVIARNTAEDQKSHEKWAEDYAIGFKSQALILANYHVLQPYYKAMAKDILSGEVPQRMSFMRMYNNKYSKKVLVEQAKAPKYVKGAHVVPRKNFNAFKNVEAIVTTWTVQNAVIDRFKKSGGFILSIETDIRSSARGAKRYKILAIGATSPIIVEERFIKKA